MTNRRPRGRAIDREDYCIQLETPKRDGLSRHALEVVGRGCRTLDFAPLLVSPDGVVACRILRLFSPREPRLALS